MKKLLLPLLITSAVSSCAITAVTSQKQVNSTPAQRIVLDATEDFNQITLGDAPYYKDDRNDALGIDARIHEYRNLFAKASHVFDGASGSYDITITQLTEEDGEPLYRLLVNDNTVGIYRSEDINLNKARDLTPDTHTWHSISLNQGDTISIESAAHTNGRIPEHGGTAWARGRWQQLEISPTPRVKAQIELKPHEQPPRPYFSMSKDLLVAQFDSKSNADDIHAVAALGSLLTHPDMKGLNYIAVAGSYGNQQGEYIDSPKLFDLAFGPENLRWADANKNKETAIKFVKNRVRAVLAQGGSVWVQEAGQSNFTRDWLQALIASGVDEAIIKNNIYVVQHSSWNETQTSPDALAYIKEKTHYQAINDGNEEMKEFNHHGRRGSLTPLYVSNNPKWLASVLSKENTKSHSRTLWLEADRIIKQSGYKDPNSVIPQGGVDFSNIVVNWWIFDLGYKAPSVHGFWDRYVTNAKLDLIKPPTGRLAVVIDGNSPDPDDLGATPVMFGLLKQTGLKDRLVHLSYACDLDPFRNKGVQRIDEKNEARRQKMLTYLADEGMKLYGPFNNLRGHYNCRIDQQAATQDLLDAINNSSAADPLWIIEAGEPDLIGFALDKADRAARKHVKVISHHPANDNSGDFFSWQQILDYGITQYQVGDQNVGLQTPTYPWDWAKNHSDKGIAFIWKMLAYAEQDGVVNFQTGKHDCSDAGMTYWWITGADQGGNKSPTIADIKDMLLLKQAK